MSVIMGPYLMRAIDFQFSPWYNLRRSRCVKNAGNLVVILMSIVGKMNTDVDYIGEVKVDIDVVTNTHSLFIRDCTGRYKYVDLESHKKRDPEDPSIFRISYSNR